MTPESGVFVQRSNADVDIVRRRIWRLYSGPDPRVVNEPGRSADGQDEHAERRCRIGSLVVTGQSCRIGNDDCRHTPARSACRTASMFAGLGAGGPSSENDMALTTSNPARSLPARSGRPPGPAASDHREVEQVHGLPGHRRLDQGEWRWVGEHHLACRNTGPGFGEPLRERDVPRGDGHVRRHRVATGTTATAAIAMATAAPREPHPVRPPVVPANATRMSVASRSPTPAVRVVDDDRDGDGCTERRRQEEARRDDALHERDVREQVPRNPKRLVHPERQSRRNDPSPQKNQSRRSRLHDTMPRAMTIRIPEPRNSAGGKAGPSYPPAICIRFRNAVW